MAKIIDDHKYFLLLKNKNNIFYFYLNHLLVQFLDSSLKKKYDFFMTKISNFFCSKYFFDLEDDYKNNIKNNEKKQQNYSYIPSLTFMNIKKSISSITPLLKNNTAFNENPLLNINYYNNKIKKQIQINLFWKYCRNSLYKKILDKISIVYTSIIEKDIPLNYFGKQMEYDFEIDNLFNMMPKN